MPLGVRSVGEELRPQPVKGGGITFVFGNDVEENGAAVGVLLASANQVSTLGG